MDQETKDKILLQEPFFAPQFIDNLFSWQELERLINLSPMLNDLRFHILNNSKYEWQAYYWKTDHSAYPLDLVKEEIKKHVCYVQDVSRINKKVNSIVCELEKLTGFPTDAHIFFALTDDKSEGLGLHNDISDNFIVQVEGQTNFKVWDMKAEDGVSNTDYINETPMIDIIMNAGDAIYIPKKYWHHAISQSKRLSISFPMSPTNNKTYESRNWIDINHYLQED